MSALAEIAHTRGGKLFVFFWLLMFASLIGLMLTGLADREIAQAASFSILVAGVLMNICIIISYWTGAKSARIARWTWIVLTILALCIALAMFGTGKKDADIVLAYAMVVLSFPVGFFIGPMIGSALSWDGFGSLVIYWVVNAIFGYLQWFVVLPHLISAFRSRNKSKVPGSN